MAMRIGAQLALVSRMRVQACDFAPDTIGRSRFEGVLVGASAAANPFLGLGDRGLFDWPTAGFRRDMSALSNDFWRAIVRSTDRDAPHVETNMRLFDPDAVVR